MTMQLTPVEWIGWQICHYEDRVANARTFPEKIWLRRELFNLKKQQQAWQG